MILRGKGEKREFFMNRGKEYRISFQREKNSRLQEPDSFGRVRLWMPLSRMALWRAPRRILAHMEQGFFSLRTSKIIWWISLGIRV